MLSSKRKSSCDIFIISTFDFHFFATFVFSCSRDFCCKSIERFTLGVRHTPPAPTVELRGEGCRICTEKSQLGRSMFRFFHHRLRMRCSSCNGSVRFARGTSSVKLGTRIEHTQLCVRVAPESKSEVLRQKYVLLVNKRFCLQSDGGKLCDVCVCVCVCVCDSTEVCFTLSCT